MFLADTTTGTPSSTSSSTPWYANLLTQGMSLYQQIELQKTNLARAQQGLPPLTASQYGATVPTATVNVGLSSGTKAALWLVGGGVVLIGIAVISRKRNR